MARNKDKPAPVIEPRCLTLQQAADYCALTRSGSRHGNGRGWFRARRCA